MAPGLRRFALTVHVISSIGWFGAVAAFLALAIVGMTNQNAQLVRSAYLAMDLTTWFVVLPMAAASLLTGIASSLGTGWGLVKLLITIFATLVLLMHVAPIDLLAAIAARTAVFSADLHGRRLLMVTASGAALVVLIVLTVLSVYKPRGMTRYGARKRYEHRSLPQP